MKKKNLWAPWRFNYVKSPSSDECIFCKKAKSDDDKSNYIIYRGQYCFSLLNIYPYNNGHIMIAPYRHISKFVELSKEEIVEIMQVVKDMQKLMKEKLNCGGFNVGFNEGKVAGAGIADHLHLHVVPRWQGDTSFMSVVANTEVIPESLNSIYDKLKN